MKTHWIAAGLALALVQIATPARKPAVDAAFQKKLPKDRQILHALNRLTYGPRPGEPDEVRKVGLKKWIERQLNPDRIAESPELLALLAPLDSLRMNNREIVETYPPQQAIVAYATGRIPLPSDPAKRLMIEKLAYRYRNRLKNKGVEPNAPETPALVDLLAPRQIRALRSGTPEERAAVLTALPPGRVDDVVEAIPPRLRGSLLASAPEPIRRKLMFRAAPQLVLMHDLQDAKLYRAIYANRQLEEILTDFWFNCFNVFLEKGADRYLVTSFERDGIRPHVLGKFRDLLQATAEHPAMLFYLDNWQSAAPGTPAGKGRTRGLNENYARELLELHTLGVDGGYSQEDIVEVARCFTGWTIRDLNRGARFEFNPKIHDDGEKIVLGVRIPAGGGRDDGLKVLDMLARSPATARHISRELARRFVADNPPEPLIKVMTDTFRKTDGDLRAVMKKMLKSREFWSQGAWRAKIKSPLELVASGVRASAARVASASVLSAKVAELGQPLYRKMEPTGYSSRAGDWVSSAALLARMNFALALAGNRLPGVKLDTSRWSGAPDQVARDLLFTPASAQTRDAIARAFAEGDNPIAIVGLVLGSPEFQRK